MFFLDFFVIYARGLLAGEFIIRTEGIFAFPCPRCITEDRKLFIKKIAIWNSPEFLEFYRAGLCLIRSTTRETLYQNRQTEIFCFCPECLVLGPEKQSQAENVHKKGRSILIGHQMNFSRLWQVDWQVVTQARPSQNIQHVGATGLHSWRW